jgi:hypothetical protein
MYKSKHCFACAFVAVTTTIFLYALSRWSDGLMVETDLLCQSLDTPPKNSRSSNDEKRSLENILR